MPNIGQEDIVVSIDDDSIDDDVVDETVKEMHDILVKIPPFNPLRSDSATGRTGIRLRPVPSTVKRTKSTEDSVDKDSRRVDKGNARSRQGGYGCSRSRRLQLFGGSRDGWSTSADVLKVGGNQLQKDTHHSLQRSEL